ncbi:AAA family ATPase, partial [Streptomyces aureus]
MADVWTRKGGDSAPSAQDRGQVPGPLVGRERESRDLRALLENHRLVTVAGEVGVGKSRLAAEAVAEAVAHEVGECVLGVGKGRPAAEEVAGVGAQGAGPRVVVVRWPEGRQDAGSDAGPGSPVSLTAAVMEAAAGV